MNKSPDHSRESSAAMLFESTFASFLHETLPLYKKEGLSGVSRELLRRIGIEVKCLQESNPEFLLMRNRLNTRPGVIISNHPWAGIDVALVLQAIKRTDIKIMVTEKRFPQFSELYGDHFMPASTHGSHAKKNVEDALRHVEGGGVFLIFPSGGNEIREGRTQFQSSFRAIIERLDPDTMVYAFHVSGEDIQALAKTEKNHSLSRLVRMRVGMYPKHPHAVRLNEAYTTCEQWQKVLGSRERSANQNIALTREYYRLFDEDPGV